MSLNSQVSAERLHIGFLGLRNAGKSSVVNAVTGQALSLVSAVKGTTTDPVHKAMELLPLGPVVVIDTPGLDDEGELGEMRVRRARQVLAKTDIAVLVVDAALGMQPQDEALCARRAQHLPEGGGEKHPSLGIGLGIYRSQKSHVYFFEENIFSASKVHIFPHISPRSPTKVSKMSVFY